MKSPTRKSGAGGTRESTLGSEKERQLQTQVYKPNLGHPLELQFAAFRVRDGKIHSFDIYFDSAPFPK